MAGKFGTRKFCGFIEITVSFFMIPSHFCNVCHRTYAYALHNSCLYSCTFSFAVLSDDQKCYAPDCQHEFTEYKRASIKRENCENCQRQLFTKDPLFQCVKCFGLLCRECQYDALGIALSLYAREDTYGSLASTSGGDSIRKKADSVCEHCGIACEVTNQVISQTSKQLCQSCRTLGAKSEQRSSLLGQIEGTRLFYKEDDLYYRDGRRRERRVSPEETEKLLVMPSLMMEHLRRPAARVQGAQSLG